MIVAQTVITLGEVVATTWLFLLSIFATLVFFALSAVLLAFRYSFRAGVFGTILGVVVFIALSTLIDAGTGFIIGLGGFITGVLLVRWRWGFIDPVRFLHHRLVTIGHLMIAIIGVIGSFAMWSILIGALGTYTFFLLIAHPVGMATLLFISLGPAAIAFLILTAMHGEMAQTSA